MRLVACFGSVEVLVVSVLGDLVAAVVVGSDNFAEDHSLAALALAQDSAADTAGQ